MCYPEKSSGGLPALWVLKLEDPPAESEPFVEFRLIYGGRLPAASRADARTLEKHQLRKVFHKQLRELWQQHPELRRQGTEKFITSSVPSNIVRSGPPPITRAVGALEAHPDAKPWVEHVADAYQRLGGRFVPLVRKAGGFTCSLDILFLRRDNPGGMITSGGDIDNRIKVLLDGLRMPDTVQELGGLPLEADEDPFFCLLEDDDLITSLSVTTDRLLLPLEAGDRTKDVYLLIHVNVLNPSALFAGNRLL